MKGGHEMQNCYVFFNFQALFLKMNIFEVATFFLESLLEEKMSQPQRHIFWEKGLKS